MSSINVKKAEALRPLIEAINDDASELDDALASLEDPDNKGEDRQGFSDDLMNAFANLRDTVNDLEKKLSPA